MILRTSGGGVLASAGRLNADTTLCSDEGRLPAEAWRPQGRYCMEALED